MRAPRWLRELFAAGSTSAERLEPLSTEELAKVYCRFVLEPYARQGGDTSKLAPFSELVKTMGRPAALAYLAHEVNVNLGVG